jgi:antitoxin VapB
MSLNIKNERTHALVRELATLTGMSQTEAVEDSVRRRLDELKNDADREGRVERILALGRQMAPGLRAAGLIDHAELLYDENGLPK